MLASIFRTIVIVTIFVVPAQLFALGGLSSSSSALHDVLLAQISRRDEIERLIDQAPEQRGNTNPTGRYPTVWTEDDLPAGIETSRWFLWDIGGWIRNTLTTFDTVEDTDRTLRDYDARVWGKINITDHHSVYGRVRSFFTDYNSSDAPGGGRNENWLQLRVDQAFYEGRLARSLGLDKSIDIDVTIGRQFFFMGKGIALANVFDGIRVDARYGEHGLMAMGAQTIHYSPDFDSTVPETVNESDRQFYGVYGYTSAFLDRRFYAYALAQVDRNHYQTTTQNWSYQSYYFGLGGDGPVPLPWVRPNEISYSAEVMVQTGRSYATGTTTKEDILAYGWLLDFFWLPGDRIPIPSKFVLSYYFGSGDGDRGVQRGTVGGNTAGTDDSALNFFGFANTGFTLAPLLTNLHMVKLNGEVTPIKDSEHYWWTREIKVGAAIYGFFKHHSGATITDFTSVRDTGYVGTEFNVYVDWSVLSDLEVAIRDGLFMPGAAFEFHDTRNFFSFALNFAF